MVRCAPVPWVEITPNFRRLVPHRKPWLKKPVPKSNLESGNMDQHLRSPSCFIPARNGIPHWSPWVARKRSARRGGAPRATRDPLRSEICGCQAGGKEPWISEVVHLGPELVAGALLKVGCPREVKRAKRPNLGGLRCLAHGRGTLDFKLIFRTK